MNVKFVLLAAQAIFVFFVIMLVPSMLRMTTLFDLLTVFAVLTAFGALVLIGWRRYWVGLALASWMIAITIPIAPLDTVTIGFIVFCAIGGLYILERFTQQKGLISLRSLGNQLLFLAAVILFVRLMMDRPGSARMGGIGGLRHALGYTAALPFFFIMEKLAREQEGRGQSVLRMICWVAILMLFWRLAIRVAGLGDPMPFYLGWYEGPMWLLAPITLSWLLNRPAHKKGLPIAALIVSLFALLLGILSPFRSRIFFAAGSISAVFWCSGYRRRFVMAGAFLLCIMIPLLVFMPKERVPVVARRALSTILPYDRADVEAIRERGVDVSGEYGWGSGFRAFLFEAAMRNIRRNPLMGQGWGISIDDLVLASSLNPYERMMYALVASGEYHNSFLAIAVKSGLPAAILTGLAFLLLAYSCIRKVDTVPEGDIKILYIGIVGALVAVTGQMIMNGGYRELQGVCIFLGFLRGTLASPACSELTEQPEANS